MAHVGRHSNLALGIAVLGALMLLIVLVAAMGMEIALPRG
ncbi:hypothetical protein FHU14_002383 [Mesorhizobium sp. RMAD-H1]|nr:hypothetical protein [Mesorhizobium sp. RMAD-H1]